jgi:hypothetical protein
MPQKEAVSMSSAASPPTVPPRARRAALGSVALGLVVGILAVGIGALFVDGAAVPGDAFETSRWPVHPLVIVVLMGIGLLVALVLGFRAIATRQGRNLGAAAIVVGVVPELLCLAIVALVVYNAIF